MVDFQKNLFGRSLATVLSVSLVTSSLVACGGAPAGDPSAGSSAEATTGVRAATATTPVAAHDGEAVLRGVFFGRGPVAAMVPDLWGDGVPLGERTAADDPKALADQVDRYAETLCKQGCSDTARDGLRAAAERIRSGEEEQLVGPDPNTAFTRTRGPAVDAAISAVVADIASQDPAFLDRFGADMQSGNPIRVKRAVEDASHRILEAAVHVQRDTRGALDLGAHPQARPNEGDGDDSPVIVYLVVAVVVLLAVVAVLPEPQVQRVGDGLTYDRFIANLTDHLQHS